MTVRRKRIRLPCLFPSPFVQLAALHRSLRQARNKSEKGKGHGKWSQGAKGSGKDNKGKGKGKGKSHWNNHSNKRSWSEVDGAEEPAAKRTN